MEPMHSEEARYEGALLRSMVFLSTLSTAAAVWQAARERRAGHDPSDQEQPAVVRPLLHRARRELEGAAARLRAGLVYSRHVAEVPSAALVRRFDALMILHRTAETLHVVHRRLLSLYPEVPEGLVEEARQVQQQCSAVLEVEDDAFPETLEALVAALLAFTAHLERGLAAST